MPDLSHTRPRYNFQDLKHGDAIMVEKPNSTIEMFRRWRRSRGLSPGVVKLVYAGENEEGLHVFFFVEQALVRTTPLPELASDDI
jgi:hypothetical protein